MKILTLDDLQQRVPAAFADSPADRVSSRYSFIPTMKIVDEVQEHGWFPVAAFQSHKVEAKGHSTHKITFRRSNEAVRVGDVIPQIELINNHMGLHRFRFDSGLFRLACSNGLVVSMNLGNSRIEKIHIDKASVEVFQALTDAINRAELAAQTIPKWQAVELNFVEKQEFAKRAVLIRNNDNVCWSNHFDAHVFLQPRRDVDRPDNLWTVFNRVQENVIKGGVQGVSRTLKPITQIKEVQRINHQLWQLAAEFGALHGVN